MPKSPKNTAAMRRLHAAMNPTQGHLSKPLHEWVDKETGVVTYVKHRGDGNTLNIGASKRKERVWAEAVARSRARKKAKIERKESL